MQELIISVSGLRGVVGESLTPEGVVRYVAAFAAELPEGEVLLARDGRDSGPMVANAVRAALLAAGHGVLDAGVAATPTVGVLVRDQRCVAGVQVTASHNPAEYNGLKLFGPDGRILPASAGQAVADRFAATPPHWVAHDQLGEARSLADSTTAHLQLVEAIVDVERIRAAHFKVLLDANHGSGAVLGRRLLETLGCEVIVLGEQPDGQFEHPPEPTAENLADVFSRASREEVAVTFCQDPDADRLAIIDEHGRYLGEESTLTLCVAHMLRQTRGPVVTNCSSSQMTRDLAEKYDVPCFHSAVGEANVVDVMQAHGAVIGGEGGGGVIHPRVGWVRDSFVAMAMVLDAMAARRAPVSSLADELPQYAIHKTKLTLPKERAADAFKAIEAAFPDAAASKPDGLRLDWPRKWLLVRPSNTEPIVRVIAEAPSEAEAVELCDRANAAIAAVLN